MDEEEEMKKFEMEGNEEKEKKNTLDKEALCERLIFTYFPSGSLMSKLAPASIEY